MKKSLPLILCALFWSAILSAQVECKTTIDFTGPSVVPIKPVKGTLPPNPPPTLGPNDERIVYWVHGLGGNEGSLGRASQASTYKEYNSHGFQARMLQSVQAAYDENAGLITASDDVRADINLAVVAQNEENVDPNSNFFISHSQGGLVTSALLYKDFCSQPIPEDERHYGGFVSVCSSLQGARILNNQQTLIEMNGRACDALLAGPVYDQVDGGVFNLISFFAPPSTSIVENTCDFFEEHFVPALFASRTTATTEEYAVGSAQIDWFNNCQTSGIDRVAFYGVEPTDNLIWRTLGYFVNSPNEFDAWEANEDNNYLATVIASNTLKYEQRVQSLTNRMNYLESWGFPCSWWEWIVAPIPCAAWDTEYWDKYHAKIEWQKGVNWFSNVNQEFMFAIGALEYQTNTSAEACECIIFEENMPGPAPDIIVLPGPCSSNNTSSCTYYFETSTTQTQLVEKTTDGIVLTESSMNMPSSTHSPILLNNTSHVQARNNMELKNALTNLYNGNYGEFFQTDIRE